MEILHVELSQLNPWSENPRINDHAVDAVSKSIKKFGFNVPILCDKNFTIIAGHTRWKAAKSLGLQKVPVIVQEMNKEALKAFSIADNKTAEIADWDFVKLRNILSELKDSDFDITTIGFTKEEIKKLLGGNNVDENCVPDENEACITLEGDIWILGKHKLMCGDSRDASLVQKLVGCNKIDHIFAGPPYYNQREYAHWEKYEDYINDMSTIATNCMEVIRDGGVIMWNIANDCSCNIDLTGHNSRVLEETGFKYLDTIIWLKTGGNFGNPRNFHIRRNGCYYPAFQWEALLVYQKHGEMPKMSREAKSYMLNHQTNVWEVPAITNQVKTYGHTAVCPVEIPYRSILAYSGCDDIVFEPFGGSGTTLIAAEKAKRKALLMEQHPKYCDIIVNRWEAYTGEKATREYATP